MLSRGVVFCAIVSVTFAALAIGPLEIKPDKYKDVEGCFIRELDIMLPVGQATPSKESCMNYRCSEDHITYETCGAVAVSPPCKTVQHLDQPYPDCCPKIECPTTSR